MKVLAIKPLRDSWLVIALPAGAAPVAAAAVALAPAGLLRWLAWATLALSLGALTWSAQSWRRRLARSLAAGAAAEACAVRAVTELRDLREALGELPTGLEIYDPADRLIFYNKRLQELYPWIGFEHQVGQTFENILRQSIAQGRIPGAMGREEDWLRERLASRGKGAAPILQNLKSGHWINTYELRSKSNYVVGVRLEVTDLIRRTQELQDSQERLQAIIGSAPVGIVTADVEGTIVDVNAAAAALFGHSGEELVGRPIAEWVPELDAAALAVQADTLGAPAAAARRELTGLAQSGEALRLQVSVAAIGAGAARQFVVIIIDLSDLARAEDARRALETQLRESQKLEAIGTLASGIAHDFNNALASILGNTDLARLDVEQGIDLEPGTHARALSSLDLIRRSALRARHLVRQILTFGRRQPTQRKAQALQPIVDAAVNILRATLPANVRIETRFATEPHHVLVDSMQIEQVVLNLCTNAWQAMDEAGGRIEIGIARAQTGTLALVERPDVGHHVNLWIADDGAGMDDATRQRAFDPFFTTKPTGAGTGLGLSVVHGIVQAHEGAITLESAPGRGTRFDLYFAEVEAPPVRDEGDGPAQVAAIMGRGERILYVDDDEVMTIMVDRLLQRSGYQVRCFSDPVAALAAVRTHPDEVDVVVTDFNMPGLSGLAVAAALAALREDLPVVLVSGLVSDELRMRAAQCGVCEVLEKQFALEALAPAVQRALSHPAAASRAA